MGTKVALPETTYKMCTFAPLSAAKAKKMRKKYEKSYLQAPWNRPCLRKSAEKSTNPKKTLDSRFLYCIFNKLF